MQSLHLVGFTDDRQGLVFSARQGGKPVTYLVELDQALVDAVLAHAETSLGRVQGARSAASGLSPREIQARLRAGATVTAIADEAGVSPAWVERFAPPVLAERENAVSSARTAKLSAPRRGVSAAPLGEAVDAALAERGVGLDGGDPDASWSARQVAGTTWAVDLTFRQRGRLQRAEWRYDTSKRTLTAVNRLAGDLGWVAGAAPEAPVTEAPAAAEATAPAGRGAARRRPVRRAGAPKLRAVGASPPRRAPAARGATRADAARTAELRAARAARERAAKEAERAAARRVVAAEREAARQALAAQKAAAKVAAAAEREAARTRAAAERAAAKRAVAAEREAARTLAAASRTAAASARPRRRVTAPAAPPPAASSPAAVAAVAVPSAAPAAPTPPAARPARRTPSARVQAALAVAETRRALEEADPRPGRRRPAHAKRSDGDGDGIVELAQPETEATPTPARSRPLRAATRGARVAEPGA